MTASLDQTSLLSVINDCVNGPFASSVVALPVGPRYHLMLHGWVISWWVISIRTWLYYTSYYVAKGTPVVPLNCCKYSSIGSIVRCQYFVLNVGGSLVFLTVCFSMFLSFVNALTLFSVIDAMEVGLDTLSWCLQ